MSLCVNEEFLFSTEGRGQCCRVMPGLDNVFGVYTLKTSSQEQSAICPGWNRLKSSPYTNSVWCSNVSMAIFIVKSHNLSKEKCLEISVNGVLI
jgi:hypothetical protein